MDALRLQELAPPATGMEEIMTVGRKRFGTLFLAMAWGCAPDSAGGTVDASAPTEHADARSDSAADGAPQSTEPDGRGGGIWTPGNASGAACSGTISYHGGP